MQNLFGRVFGGEPLPETVSGGSVTDSNIMIFLGMIEEKTNSLLQVCMRTPRLRLGMRFWNEHGGHQALFVDTRLGDCRILRTVYAVAALCTPHSDSTIREQFCTA